MSDSTRKNYELQPKRCPQCGNTYPRTSEYWHKDKIKKDGWASACKTCHNAASRRWKQTHPKQVSDYDKKYRKANAPRLNEQRRQRYKANPEPARQRARHWYRNNPEKAAAARRLWSQLNRQKVREYALKWRQQNPEKRRAAVVRYNQNNVTSIRERKRQWKRHNPLSVRHHSKLRYARERGATGSHTRQEVLDLLEWQDGKCLYCGTNIRETFVEDHYIPLASTVKRNDIHNIVLACANCNGHKHDKLPWLWDNRLL